MLDSLGKLVAIDTETTGLRWFNGDRPFAVSLCDDEGRTAFMRWEVNPNTREVTPRDRDLDALRRLLGSGRRFVFHHGKFDIHMLRALGLDLPEGSWDDTLVAWRTLSTMERTYALKPLALRYAQYPTTDESELRKATYSARREGKKASYDIGEEVPCDYWLAPPKLLEKYALGDVERTMLLWLLADKELVADRPTYDLEMRLQPVVLRMEERGVRVDMGVVNRSYCDLTMEIASLEDELRSIVGKDFNPNSHVQRTRFFGSCRVDSPLKTKRGKPSYSTAALEEMDHPVARLLIQHADLYKSRTFFASWQEMVVERKGETCLFPSFEPQAARTGRFGCRAPNLQQVPKSDPVASARARAPFIPRDGHAWIAADYSQMELRMMADPVHADDRGMRETLLSGGDIHKATAIRLFGQAAYDAAETENGNSLRSAAKAITFGIQYGMGADKLARSLKITVEKAKEYLAQYKKAFAGITTFMARCSANATSAGSIRTPYGRRLEVDRFEPYKATNYAIQGSGADVCKRAMISLDDYWRLNKLPGGMILTIHDEIAIEVPIPLIKIPLIRAVKELMEAEGYGFVDPLPVDPSLVYESWAHKEEVLLGEKAWTRKLKLLLPQS